MQHIVPLMKDGGSGSLLWLHDEFVVGILGQVFVSCAQVIGVYTHDAMR